MKDADAILKALMQKQEFLSLDEDTNAKNAARSDLEYLINELIQKDFPLLVQWLYRIDVDERKLKLALEQHQQADASFILADMIIERQLQKHKFRQSFPVNRNIPDEDRW